MVDEESEPTKESLQELIERKIPMNAGERVMQSGRLRSLSLGKATVRRGIGHLRQHTGWVFDTIHEKITRSLGISLKITGTSSPTTVMFTFSWMRSH